MPGLAKKCEPDCRLNIGLPDTFGKFLLKAALRPRSAFDSPIGTR